MLEVVVPKATYKNILMGLSNSNDSLQMLEDFEIQEGGA
ncbi:hypothetical protein Gotri_004677 [Gossypium trilobum]|uniref:Uncharacterized protein n=1 Tax=Gossypium trilobum TaxID=34281 RepID=A0A7J9F5X6_9ROSI|nr:hypothetical protein [Gossypium trilobum]